MMKTKFLSSRVFNIGRVTGVMLMMLTALILSSTTGSAQAQQAHSFTSYSVKPTTISSLDFTSSDFATTILKTEYERLEAEFGRVEDTVFESTNYFTRSFILNILQGIENGVSVKTALLQAYGRLYNEVQNVPYVDAEEIVQSIANLITN